MHAARALVPVRVLSLIASRVSRSAFFRGALRVAFVPAVLGGALALMAGVAQATPPPGATLNACGCYRDDSGVCFCEKKSKCGCEGECEPKGCEEKRAKEREKELENEIKLAKQRGGSHEEKAEDGSRGKTRASEKTTGDDDAPSRKASKPEPKRSSSDDDGGAVCPPCPCAEGKARSAKSAKPPKASKETAKDVGK